MLARKTLSKGGQDSSSEPKHRGIIVTADGRLIKTFPEQPVVNKDKFLIKGLGGKKKLSGTIEVGGSKNTALKLFAATLLFEDTVHFENVPDIADIRQVVELMRRLGAEIERTDTGSYSINTKNVVSGYLDNDIAKRLRASVVFTGPLLARFGKISFPHPGGCVIGQRPIDIFLDSYKKMGARIREDKKSYIINAPKGLRGAALSFKSTSVTATETLMMAAVLSKGMTVIFNSALEPEVANLAKFLKSGGADIEGIGTHTLIIRGGKMLQSHGLSHTVPPDRIEAGSFLILGALAAHNLVINNCDPEELMVPIELLREAGVKIRTTKNSITVSGKDGQEYKSVDLKTHEYPGFPTDLQAPMTVFLTQAKGDSLIFETIFEGRLAYAEDLSRMGANILSLDPHRILVKGKTSLRGRELESPDLRAGLAFLIAALVAKGESVLNNVHYIDRGYECIEKRLARLGAQIERVR